MQYGPWGWLLGNWWTCRGKELWSDQRLYLMVTVVVWVTFIFSKKGKHEGAIVALNQQCRTSLKCIHLDVFLCRWKAGSLIRDDSKCGLCIIQYLAVDVIFGLTGYRRNRFQWNLVGNYYNIQEKMIHVWFRSKIFLKKDFLFIYFLKCQVDKLCSTISENIELKVVQAGICYTSLLCSYQSLWY